MRVATRDERDRLLHLGDALLQKLRDMHSAQVCPDEMIAFMERTGVPKPGATVALRRAGVMSLAEAKSAVHFSNAYAYRREADEAFEDSVVQALDELARSGRAAYEGVLQISMASQIHAVIVL